MNFMNDWNGENEFKCQSLQQSIVDMRMRWRMRPQIWRLNCGVVLSKMCIIRRYQNRSKTGSINIEKNNTFINVSAEKNRMTNKVKNLPFNFRFSLDAATKLTHLYNWCMASCDLNYRLYRNTFTRGTFITELYSENTLFFTLIDNYTQKTSKE